MSLQLCGRHPSLPCPHSCVDATLLHLPTAVWMAAFFKLPLGHSLHLALVCFVMGAQGWAIDQEQIFFFSVNSGGWDSQAGHPHLARQREWAGHILPWGVISRVIAA